jgi:hypothetical protein
LYSKVFQETIKENKNMKKDTDAFGGCMILGCFGVVFLFVLSICFLIVALGINLLS